MATPLLALPLLPDQSPSPSPSLGIVKHVVPWKSREEFLEIYHDVYSEDESRNLRAINRIAAWKSRVGLRLSVAVESTRSLLESIILHQSAVKEGQVRLKESVLCSSYSLAIIRFVNLVIEKGQTEYTAVPVHSLAKKFGIPDWIVRLRHDATHNSLPCLDLLATGAEWALQYLKEEFWDCQTHDATVGKKHHSIHDNAKLCGKIKKSLRKFRLQRLQNIKSEEDSRNVTVASNEMQELKDYIKEHRFCFVRCLLKDGFIIPTDEQLEDFGLTTGDIMKQPSPSLPVDIQILWQPVLFLMQSLGAISLFAKFAMFSISDEDCLRNHFLTAWLIFMLRSGEVSAVNKKGKKWKCLLTKKLLLRVCLEKVNKFTIILLKYLIDREELGEEAYLKLSKLLCVNSPTVITQSNSFNEEDEEDSGEEGLYTIKDVKEASLSLGNESISQSDLENVQQSVDKVDDIGWKVCTDFVDWSRVPLGVIPSFHVDDGDDNEEEGDAMDQGSHDDDDDHENDGQHAREWKRSKRKRGRSSPKRSTYVVKDTDPL